MLKIKQIILKLRGAFFKLIFIIQILKIQGLLMLKRI